jgi:phosphatidylglycerophosphatase C
VTIPGPATARPDPDRPVVAAFDFDGTLTDRGSVWPFLATVSGRRRVVRAALADIGPLAAAAALGGRHADEAKEALFGGTLGGLDAVELEARAAQFGLDHYRRHARADVRDRLEWHRAQGHRLLIVSASPEIYLTAVGRELAVDGVIATRLAVDGDGRMTGGYDGKNCRGQEKIDRVRQWMVRSGPPGGDGSAITPFLWAYGNSKGDRRLLQGADRGVDVGRLGPVGALRSFPRLGDVATDGYPN